MGAEQIREILHRRIEQADERFLRILYAMAEAYATEYLEEEATDEQVEAAVADVDLKPMTKEALISEIKEADAQIEKGEFFTIDDLEEEAEQW